MARLATQGDTGVSASAAKTTSSTANLTVMGQPANATQKACAKALYAVGVAKNANSVALQAVFFTATFESTMGTNNGPNSAGYGGPLAGSITQYFGKYGSASSQAVLEQEATSFFEGGRGFQGGGAIAMSSQTDDPAVVSVIVQQPDINGAITLNNDPLVNNQYYKYEGGAAMINKVRSEAATWLTWCGGTNVAGGVYGAGGSGTSADDTNPSTPFYIGGSSNPNEDFWTAINRLAQERQWYLFSDTETMWLAAGNELMQQTPAMTLDRFDDSYRITHLDFNWDNTAFEYAINRKKSATSKVQRKSTLQKIQSPVQANLTVICDIDEVRGGDVIELTGCGPGDGKWLVSDVTRSIFSITSDITLVPAVAPLTEQESEGSLSTTTGAAASEPGSGTVMASMLKQANILSADAYPYVWGGGHGQLGVPSVGVAGDGNTMTVKGFDCSGSVSAVLGAGGLITAPASTESMHDALGSFAIAGQGRGNPECTIFLDPSSHVFMRLNGQYFGTSIGMGADPSGGYRVNSASSGPTWWKKGSPAPDTENPDFKAYHIAQNVLESVSAETITTTTTGGTSTGTSTGDGPAVMYDSTATVADLTADKYWKDDPPAIAGYVDGQHANYSSYVSSFPNADHLSITTSSSNHSADCLDVFNTGVDASAAGAWAVAVRTAKGSGSTFRPCIYCSAAQVTKVRNSLTAQGLDTDQYRLWVRDPTNKAHVPAHVDACQWKAGPSYTYNTSQLQADFFD